MTGTLIHLTHPIGPISSVTVRIPVECEWDAPPAGIQEPIWNFSRAAGLTVDQTKSLTAVDVEGIAVAFEAAIANWNLGQGALRAGLA